MRSAISKPLSRVLTSSLALLLLLISFSGVDWKEFTSCLASCDWRLLLASAVAGGSVPMLRALRWRHTVMPFSWDIGIRLSVFSNYAAYLVNMAMPLTHEATRCVIVHRSAAGRTVPYDKLVGVAITERVCDAFCVLLLFIFIASTSWRRYGRFVIDKADGVSFPLLLLVVAVITILVLLLDVTSHGVRRLAGVRKFFDGVHEGLMTIFHLERPLLYLSETAMLWGVYWLQLFLAAKAVPGVGDINSSDCLFLVLSGTLSTLIPVPGGFGAFHYITASVLGILCGTGWTEGMAFATLVHESQALVLLVLGFISILLLPSVSAFPNRPGHAEVETKLKQ